LIPLFALVTAVAAASAQAAGEGTKPLTITSNLQGKTVLPHRIHWLASPKLRGSQVAEVDFLIDGKLRWVEHTAPYTYGDNGNWLVTSWLPPGPHRFSVRAKAINGESAQLTTKARVLPATAPPAELVGSWSRTVTQAEAGDGLAGTWVLSVDSSGWKIRDPQSTGNYIDVAYPASGRLQARGGIWTKPRSDFEGNGWCEDTNTPVDYRWDASGGSLALTLDGVDGCGGPGEGQHRIWAGVWTRLP
jgi:hypothetical protein